MGKGGTMRGRGFAFLVATVLAVSINAHAAPSVTAFAVDTKGQSVVLSSSNHTVVIQISPTAAPVNAKLTCLKLIRASANFPLEATEILATGVAAGKMYYVGLVSFGPQGDKAVQAVLDEVVTRRAGQLACGVGNNFAQAVGVALTG